MFTPIAGRSVLVTGGSKGIGKGIARVFAGAGARVMIAARRKESAQQTAREIREAGGIAEHVCGDVGRWEDMREMVDATARAFGGLDILCANAGIFPQTKIIDMDPSEWDRVMATNLKGAFLAVKAAIPFFEKAGKGRVILTSSITGPINGFPGWSHYAASKAGQLGFLRTASMELVRYNTTINAILPGNVMTEGLTGLGAEYLETMTACIPLGRLATVEEIGHAALFFASDEAGYITGQTLVVDGGHVIPETPESLAEI